MINAVMEVSSDTVDKDRRYLENYLKVYGTLMLKSGIEPQLLAFRDLCLQVKARGNKLIFAGNGASASISSHAATDYTQHAKVRAVAFNDHNLITAFGNDYGYEHWVARSLEAYADPGDVVVLISSSGSSPNIVNAAKFARDHQLECVTFTGFSSTNPLRGLGHLNLWLDCNAYNLVETTHLVWILLVANLLENNDGDDGFISRGLANIAGQLQAAVHRPALTAFCNLCREVSARNGKVIFAGNGGSSSIASHAATDYTKQSRVRSVAFNDHNLLTAFANDYGQEHWLEQCIEAYAQPQDAVVLISSSGKSANILRAANLTRQKGLPLVTFSAFDPRNPLHALGQINFWADTRHYSIAEALHSGWILCVCDMLAGKPEF
ncbi:MAG: SIS domain-containing protein [Rhodocyclaceae bacterium]|nr:SIS domain-containing protein [Rhodocyclaceae bacterium]